MRVGLATLVAGRARHLRRQADAVARHGGVSRYVVVDMGGDAVAPAGARLVRVPAGGGGLPLAAARNRAIAELAGCELAILLDVDCIPSARLVARYRLAARELGKRPGLLCGPVGYLEPLAANALGPDAGQRRRARRRVIRAFPTRGLRPEPRAELFWSLSFALTPATRAAIGGFDETYRGWGAEDTDYGLAAARAGVGLYFVGGAWAYHQDHPPRHADDLGNLAANARRFRARWGFWPMPTRLAALADEGRIVWEPDGARCEPVGVVEDPARAAPSPVRLGALSRDLRGLGPRR